MGSAIVSKELCNLSLEIQEPFIGEGVLLYLGMVGKFCGDDPRFCDCQSDLVPIVWCNLIRLTLFFCRKNQFVSISPHLVPEIRGHKVGLI